MTDLIFTGGPILTADGGRPEAEAIAVRDGIITAVGDRDEVVARRTSATEVVDLGGAALLPGFVEAHGHPTQMALALAPPSVDVRPFAIQDGAAVLRTIADTAAAAQPGVPLLFYGIDVLLQPGLELPTADVLDRLAPRNPVVVVANSGHAAYGNHAALAAAGLARDTPDPPGASFVRDDSGDLTGEVLEAAAIQRLGGPAVETIAKNLPANLAWAFRQHAAAGTTTVSELAYSAGQQHLLSAAGPDALVRLRAYEMATLDLARDPARRSGPWPADTDLFGQIGMKIWADGSPWQGNIKTTFGYLDTDATRRMGLEPHHHGGANWTADQLRELAVSFVGQGFQVACHVHGDGAVDDVLDAYEAALAAHPGDWRLRLEHAGAMRPDQFQRAAKLGVTVSLFIEHLHYWGDVLLDDLFGPDHGGHWMAAQSALDAGLRVSFHNDGTVTPPSPLGNIATAVTRTARGSGRVLAPSQRVTVDAAVRAQTIDAAWQLHLDRHVGSLAEGKAADLVILAGNPHDTDPSAIRDIPVQATYLNGRRTHG
ncbi:amidohydrolase [Amycolatopsis albidoflavus]|uniref:Amidohydrolase n=5 Tax=Amycolatopsis TaxID=1813 RepID=A0ABW5HZ56_9PSEU